MPVHRQSIFIREAALAWNGLRFTNIPYADFFSIRMELIIFTVNMP